MWTKTSAPPLSGVGLTRGKPDWFLLRLWDKCSKSEKWHGIVHCQVVRAVFSGHGLEFVRGDVGSGQQLVDLAIGVSLDDPGEDVGNIAERLDPLSLQVSISEATTAQCAAPLSEPGP
jgi:hypothetical protein